MWTTGALDQNRQDRVRQAVMPGKTSQMLAGYDTCNGSYSLPSGDFSCDHDRAQGSSTKWPEQRTGLLAWSSLGYMCPRTA